MQKAEIKCQYSGHNFEKVYQFCLNKTCHNKRNACIKCIQEFHFNHEKDCFDEIEIYILLLNEQSQLLLLSNKSTPLLSNLVEDFQKQISQQIEILKDIQNKTEELTSVLEVAYNCYNNVYFTTLVSIALKKINFIKNLNQNLQYNNKLINESYQQTIPDYKALMCFKQGNLLLRRKKFSQAVEQYKICLKLSFKPSQLILNLYMALFFSKRIAEAEFVQQQNLTIFQNNTPQMIEFWHLFHSSQSDQSVFFNRYKKNYETTYANMLLNAKSFDLCIEFVERLLLMQPDNIEAIEIKVKEYITELESIKPEVCKVMKSICVFWDMKFFNPYNEYKEQNQNPLGDVLASLNFFRYLTKENLNLPKAISVIHQDGTNRFSYLHQDTSQSLSEKLEKGEELKPQIEGSFALIYKIYSHEYQSALKQVDKLLSICPISRMFNFLKSFLLIKLNQFDQGLYYAQLAMYMGSPKDFYCKYYAKCLVQNGEYEKALGEIEKIQDLNSYNNLEVKGKILALNQKFFEAQQCFEKMIQFQNNLADSQLREQSIQLQSKLKQWQAEEIESSFDYKAKDWAFVFIQIEFDFAEVAQILSAQDLILLRCQQV